MGVFSEKEKAETMMKDLEQKQSHLDDLYKGKEDLEFQIAPLACIHSIYVSVPSLDFRKLSTMCKKR